ncbi:hypothetical protein KEM55_002601, partial [Ascosphaera atra]
GGGGEPAVVNVATNPADLVLELTVRDTRLENVSHVPFVFRVNKEMRGRVTALARKRVGSYFAESVSRNNGVDARGGGKTQAIGVADTLNNFVRAFALLSEFAIGSADGISLEKKPNMVANVEVGRTTVAVSLGGLTALGRFNARTSRSPATMEILETLIKGGEVNRQNRRKTWEAGSRGGSEKGKDE